MPEAILCGCSGRIEADLLVAVLAEEGIRAVAFCDIERSESGHLLRERADVRVLLDDVEAARAVLADWTAARRHGIDPLELERQALEAGGAEVSPQEVSDAREDLAARDEATAADCPYCGAAVREGTLARVRGAFAALRGRQARSRGERLCTACGHRWTADEDSGAGRRTRP